MKVQRLTRGIRASALAAMLMLAAAACDTSGTTTDTAEPADGADAAEALGGTERVEQFEELYQAVQDAGETELVVYSAHAEESKGVYDQFMKRFPEITVTGVAVTGPSLRERIEAEFGSGQHVADVVATGITSAGLYAAGGEFEEYVPFTMPEDINPAYFDPGGRAFAAGLSPMGVIYNKDRVSDDEAPASWDELVDTRWKGDIAVQNPGVASGANGTFAQLLHDGTYDEEWIKQYVALEPRIESTGPAAATDVANGIVSIAGPIQFSYAQGLMNQGANVGYVFPLEDKNYFVGNYMGLVSGAPHPNAAKLFLSWILTPEAAAEQSKTGFYSPVEGAEPPPGLVPLSEIEVLDGVAFSEYQDYSPLTKQVMALFGG
ncbi:ABC transporter substrate-binding protein [Jiangella asiatica]|nr:extracellular solute-binding protein [Jiangella asiatica]